MRILVVILSLILFASCKTLESTSGAGNKSSLKLYVDELAQLYTTSANNTMVKFDQDGKELFEYSDNTLGPITNFDVTNPLQVLVFHKSFQTIKIFDRTLTLNGLIDLNKLNLFEIHTVASSNDNRIWIFDELNQELLKINKNGIVQGRNNDLRLRLDKNATPHYMIEYKNKVYMFDKVHGILIFDNFGEFITQRAFDGPKTFRNWQGILFYSFGSQLISYNLESGEIESKTDLEELSAGIEHYRIQEKLIFLDEENIRFKDL